MFNKEFKILILEIIKNEYAHNPEDGEIISKQIKMNYKGDVDLILDFNGITSVNTAFANKIVHGLYENYSTEILNKYFKLRNYNELILKTFQKVIENYKEVKNDLQ
ncbi:MAG: STAS-like domain-containing protein [Clostridia bacterium]|nr:STAS-like domain-containing protein [Clostridia bacterium]